MAERAKVAIIMGSDSDYDKVAPAFDILKRFGVPFTAHVMSAHRTPDRAHAFASGAAEQGYGALICAAGMAAHLAGVMASKTTLPVIGLPLTGGALDGLDALLATVMMPPGIPVATVGTNCSANAALLAVQILATADGALRTALQAYKDEMVEKVTAKDAALQQRIAE